MTTSSCAGDVSGVEETVVGQYRMRVQAWEPWLEIRHKPGRNLSADPLSRLAVNTSDDTKDLEEMLVPDDLYVGAFGVTDEYDCQGEGVAWDCLLETSPSPRD